MNGVDQQIGADGIKNAVNMSLNPKSQQDRGCVVKKY
jgi:hypothetical protein